MSAFDIISDAQVDTNLRRLETSDLVHADTFNPLFAKLINNDAALLRAANAIAGQLAAGMGVDAIDITIPADAWLENEGSIQADVPAGDVTEDMYPIVILHPASMIIAHDCGMSTVAMTALGLIRFFAEKIPDEDITGTVILINRSGNGSAGGIQGSGGTYVLPTATANRLGGVKVGDNLSVQDDGTLSVDKSDVIDDVATTYADVSDMLADVFDGGHADQ